MDVDKKLSMSLDDLIKNNRSERPKKGAGNNKDGKKGFKAGRKGPKMIVSKKGTKIGVRKSLKKNRRRDDGSGDTEMKQQVSKGSPNRRLMKKGDGKGQRRVRRVSSMATSGVIGGSTKPTSTGRKFSRRVVVKAGPNAPADTRRKIKIINIPFDLSWKDVKDALSSVGKIERCDVERGEATLIFATHKEALRAVQTYNNGDMNGRKIQVFFM